jgi:hypothetical protein
MLGRMLDPEAGPPQVSAADPPAAPPSPAAPPPVAAPMRLPAYLPLAAYATPVPAAAPPAPTWTKAYDLPSARRVVSAGLQLAVDASQPIRRGSIYIGLLSLGALGPAVVLVLLTIGRLMSDPGTAQMLTTDPSLLFFEQPELLAPLLLIYVLGIAGAILLIAIGVDAQAIAISILAGRASERPMELFEAITRARQVFWRLLAAGLLVGVTSGLIQLAVTLPFISFEHPSSAGSIFGLAIGTLFVTPFAFASTSVVLGDVGPLEALGRSWRLFRVRPRIALVVTIFTLVTSAIQQFALSAGLDAAQRFGTFMHLGFDQGGVGVVVVSLIVLAFVIAFGSLTFTIAAIVAAPQVAGFLGLTYYSGGLDRARSDTGVRPRRFRWVSAPMIFAMVGLLVVAGVDLPGVAGFQPRATSPLLGILGAAAQDHGAVFSPEGTSVLVEDPANDSIGRSLPWIDITSAGYAFLPEVPTWLLDSLFNCTADAVTCASPSPDPTAWDAGAFLFIQRMAGPPDALPADEQREWGPLLTVAGFDRAPLAANDPFGGASHSFITRVTAGRRVLRFEEYDYGDWKDVQSNARSAWTGNDLLTLIPASDDLYSDPIRWDAYAALVYPSSRKGRDELRSATTDQLHTFDDPPVYTFFSFP